MKENNKVIYFSHDTNASNDPKLISLRINFGWKAIGMYWAIIEAMHKESDGLLSGDLIRALILDFYSQEEVRTSSHIREEAKLFEESLYTTELLKEYGGKYSSKRVQENIRDINHKSEIARENINKRWYKNNTNVSKKNTGVLQKEYDGNTIKEKKRKESKEYINILPSKKSELFFSNVEKQEEVLEYLKGKSNLDESRLRREISKFISYWTELEGSGKRQRWQKQPTFEIERRLGTWFHNIRETASPKKSVNLDNIK